MAKTTELTVQESRELMLNPVFQQVKKFEMQQRMAQMFVTSTIIPQTFRGNIGNCIIAIDMAQRMGANPLLVMQNLYVVNGNPSWSSKFLISCINSSGRFTPLRYQFVGKRGTDQYACRAYAYEASDKEHKEALCGTWITMEMAKAEGWTKKAGSKWLTMPDQMLIYRAAAFWCRAYAPEISMGFMTREEVEDSVSDEIIIPDSLDDDVPEILETVEEPEQKEANKTAYRAPQAHESADVDNAPTEQEKAAQSENKEASVKVSTTEAARETIERKKRENGNSRNS